MRSLQWLPPCPLESTPGSRLAISHRLRIALERNGMRAGFITFGKLSDRGETGKPTPKMQKLRVRGYGRLIAVLLVISLYVSRRHGRQRSEDWAAGHDSAETGDRSANLGAGIETLPRFFSNLSTDCPIRCPESGSHVVYPGSVSMRITNHLPRQVALFL